MKFTVARDVLAEAVSWTARVLPTRPASPILAGMRISAQGQELTLSSFDYEVSGNSRIPASVDEEGEVLVSGRLLADISKLMDKKFLFPAVPRTSPWQSCLLTNTRFFPRSRRLQAL